MAKIDNGSWYAVKHPDIGFVRDRVFGKLNEPWEEINSGVYGDFYNSPERETDEIMIYSNRDGDGEINVETYADYPILILVSDATDFARYDKVILNDPELQAVLYERHEWEDDETAD